MLDAQAQEALDLLQEECAEIIQVISKIRRFGLDSFNPYDPDRKSNRRLLNDEIGDLTLLTRYLESKFVVDELLVEDRVKWKREKLAKYTSLYTTPDYIRTCDEEV